MSAKLKAKTIELGSAIVDGMDISGTWSRMLESRVLPGYDLSELARITGLPGGETLAFCYQCGKCTGVCPADRVGDFSPRKLFRRVQTGMSLGESPDLWTCTTCANCARVCPKEVKMLEIMPAVREEAVLAGEVPTELQKAFADTQRYGNPLGEPPRKRGDWTAKAGVSVPVISKEKKPVDILWFVECYPSYHQRGKDASGALARVLHALGADYAILGHEEKCAGDDMRLGGEKGLFEMLAEENVKTLGKYSFNRLLVTDPHAYNAFRNFYPAYGGEYDVVHYSQYLAPLLTEFAFPGSFNHRVTYHDPCYLGRHNGEYEAPRQALRAIPGLDLVEMERCRENSACCGGGGGGMYLDGYLRDFQGERLSELRVKEAVATGAEILAVACPYEVSRFEDALKSTGNEGKMRVLDLSEIIAEAMGI